MTRWVFAKLDPAAVRRDPDEGQHFRDDQAGEHEYAGTDTLVREILQNALDAGTGGGPVRVRLALHAESDGPAADRRADYFRRLQAPLAVHDVPFDAAGLPQVPGGFLVVEDFGTRGLLGDPLLCHDPPKDSAGKQDFFWFWRNIGLSGKTGDELGRWGLGKTVFRAASRVGCMFGLTIRHSDQRCLLMGQAVLHIHSIDGQQYMPEGFWCADEDSGGVPCPIESPGELELFRREWKLTRTTEPGLSVVVPCVAEQLTGIRILQAVCVHFFLPLMRGQLEVEVCADDIQQGPAKLNASTLENWCRTIRWDGQKRARRHVAPPIAFVRSCLNGGDSVGTTRLLGETKVPELTVESFEPADLQRLRSAFSTDQLVEVRVRVGLHPLQRPAEVGVMSVFLQRGGADQRLDSYYVREGMTITKLNSRAGHRGIQALVIVDTGPLAQLLGDSENPAHEDWHSSADRPKKFWKYGWGGRVKFCRSIVDLLVEVLTVPVRQADFDLLSDFFSIPRRDAPQRAGSPDRKGSTPVRLADLPLKLRWFRLDGRRGGFRIVPTTHEPMPAEAELKVSVAYDVLSGNPLKKWSSFDFDFRRKPSVIRFSGQQVEVKSLSGNELLLTCSGPDFLFSADGFDLHADLYVRIEETRSQRGSAEEMEGPNE
ncbi:MAG: hypothetical protein RLZZ436_1347 [Planctomycetota bacterium]|jgi:hypothetical protein